MKTSKIVFWVFSFLVFQILKAQENCDKMLLWHHGEGTYYGGVAGSEGGNCSLPLAADDTLHVAMNHVDYDSSNLCGACIRILGSRGEVIAKVADRCPECKPGDIDMTPQTFNVIANKTEGRNKISWQVVPCPFQDNIKIKYKIGASAYWNAIQIRNSKYPVKKLEYLDQSGIYVNIPRQMYNYFLAERGLDADKTKTGPYTFRLTSINNQVLILKNIPFNATEEVATNSQFQLTQCKDCNNELGGSAKVDNCGVCSGGNTGIAYNSTCTKDCRGYWNGIAYTDECGNCVDQLTLYTPCGKDCNGLLGGRAYRDLCGDCVGGTTGKTACQTGECVGEWGGNGYFGLFCKNNVLGMNSTLDSIDEFVIMPNPSNASFKVQSNKNTNMIVSTIYGELLETHQVNGEFSFGENLISGVYLIKIDSKTIKIVKSAQ